MNTSAATDSIATKEVPSDADVKELLNCGGKITLVGLECKQLRTPRIEKRHLKLRTDNYQFRTDFSLCKHSGSEHEKASNIRNSLHCHFIFTRVHRTNFVIHDTTSMPSSERTSQAQT
jgi:hypothetical protein